MRDMLETPVPIIVVVRAKLVGALLEFVPGNAVERHPHIVFARDPGDHFGLLDETQDICYRALSLQTGRSRDNRSVAVRSVRACANAVQIRSAVEYSNTVFPRYELFTTFTISYGLNSFE